MVRRRSKVATLKRKTDVHETPGLAGIGGRPSARPLTGGHKHPCRSLPPNDPITLNSPSKVQFQAAPAGDLKTGWFCVGSPPVPKNLLR
jgi:hypothetical protein